MYIDTHVHLDANHYEKDRELVIKKALEGGISYLINIGSDLASSNYSVLMSHSYPNVFAAVGVHPHNAYELDEKVCGKLINLAKKEKKVVAIGEIGLDYHYTFSLPAVQQKVFRRQLQIAKELGLPVVIHSREAHGDVLKILNEEKTDTLTGVFHCFSGDSETARQCLNTGFYLSVGGAITFQNTVELQEVIKTIPLDRLLVETDSPYLTPHPYRGYRNEPLYVKQVVKRLAVLKNISSEEAAKTTLKNALQLFKLDKINNN